MIHECQKCFAPDNILMRKENVWNLCVGLNCASVFGGMMESFLDVYIEIYLKGPRAVLLAIFCLYKSYTKRTTAFYYVFRLIK